MWEAENHGSKIKTVSNYIGGALIASALTAASAGCANTVNANESQNLTSPSKTPTKLPSDSSKKQQLTMTTTITGTPVPEATPSSAENQQKEEQLFENPQANEAAKRAGINIKDFFVFDDNVLDSLKAFKANELFPIYPPTVMDHKELISQLATESKIPPNVIAILMTIESVGIADSESQAGALGLFQVMPDKFDPKIQDNPETMEDEILNGQVGLKYFEEMLKEVRQIYDLYPEIYGGVPIDSARIWARAAMAYNAGPGILKVPLGPEIPDETRGYRENFLRLAETAEIASYLRQMELSDQEIIKSLVSKEIDARAYALQQFMIREILQNGSCNFEDYKRAAEELAKSPPGIDRYGLTSVFSDPLYKDYLSYDNFFKALANPALRVGAASGRIALTVDARNLNPIEWEKIDTKQ